MHHENIPWGKATLSLVTDCMGASIPEDEGGPGSGTWRFRREDIRRLRLRNYCDESVNRGGDVIRSRGSMADDLRSNGYDEDGNDEIVVSDPDTAIRLLAIMRTKSGHYEVSFESDGSSYWAWHDMGHAERDTEIGSIWRKGQTGTDGRQSDGRRAVQIHVGGEEEDNALILGAREAVRRRVPLDEIVRELVAAEKQFQERFEYQATTVERFLSGCVVSLRGEA